MAAEVRAVLRKIYTLGPCKMEAVNFTWSTDDYYSSTLNTVDFVLWFPNISSDSTGSGYTVSGRVVTLAKPTSATNSTNGTLIVIGT